MVAKLGNREDPLPQELFEGVDEDEWVKEKNLWISKINFDSFDRLKYPM